MTDYTPATEEVRDAAFLEAMDAAGGEHNLDAPAFLAMFDRWLAKVKADTLREAAESYVYVHATTRTHSRVYQWLRARADRIEGKTDD